jgi:pilus assembly protein CpaB
MLAARDLPEAYLEDRHIRAVDARKVVGVRTSHAIQANESVMWSDLATAEGRRSLSGVIQNGKRAFTVTSDNGTLSPLVRPGDRVDLLLTTERGSDTVTFPLLQNLLVLAVGSDVGQGAEERGTVAGTMMRNAVTVSVTLAQAQLIAVASRRGKVTPILRNPSDIAVIEGVLETSTSDVLEAERLSDIQNTKRVVPSAGDKEIERVR